MSELAAHYEESTLEPDENTLINALRNQDDIPILMDVVMDKEDVDVTDEEFVPLADTPSQPMGLAELVADDLREEQDASHEDENESSQNSVQEDHSGIPVLTTPEVVAAPLSAQQLAQQNESVSQNSQQAAGEQSELQEAISIALAEVLQRRLPELVEEVLHIVNERVSNSK
ncbi:hypothetical protein MSP8887_03409 [Marinomonas spartinae]|uniref:hypothetical protein n=1 Tax=Marinomonas spartinae TaxID=1792290 RepID=UPI000808BD9E|nr:hypothetical protein [Marinomonas spartinae]SBS38643.1 hypothetical protein MSP8887_03409 [Marinomonas spartinae]